MRNVKSRPSGLVRFLNILIVLTALAAVISLVRLAGELRSAFDRDQYSSLEYYLQDGEYPGMIRQYYSRHYDIDPFPSAHEESYQAAGYADAAFQHQFFQKIGDQARAQANARRMEEYRRGCGSFSVVADDIDRLLESISLDREKEDRP